MTIEQLRMVMRLAKNDIKAKYSASVLGIIWAFALPVITILVFWCVFQMGLKSTPVNDVPYILWFVVAYIPWIYFSDIMNYGTNALIDYNYLVKKVKFEVAYLPVVRVISALFVHLFFIFFIFFMFTCYHFSLTRYCLQAIYYSVSVTILGWGLSMFFSALSVFFKDISQIVNVILQIGFWITPIFWNEDSMKSEAVHLVLKFNPVHYIIQGYRDSFIYNVSIFSRRAEGVYFWGVTIVICLIGWFTFKKLRPHFADEL